VQRQQLAALCMASLPRGAVEFGHSLTGVHEDSDAVTLTFQASMHALSMAYPPFLGANRHQHARRIVSAVAHSIACTACALQGA
jgi:hypothetical protein